jgi:dihydrofolate reductase
LIEGRPVVLIAAVADNGVIGDRGGMPWRLSTDMKRFKALTTGSPVVMGRKTWESLGKPLSGRENIVISRDKDYRAAGATVLASLDDALEQAAAMAGEGGEVFVIGGGAIYREAMGAADRLYITHVHARPDGDTTFPPIDPAIWVETSREEVPAGERDQFPTSFVRYERRNARPPR